MTENTRVRIVFDNLSFEVEGPEEFVKTELEWFKESVLKKVKVEESLLVSEGEDGLEPAVAMAPQPRAFMQQKAPESNQEAAAVMAYFLEKWKETPVVNEDLISEWFRKCGRRPPKAPNQTLVDAKAKGYFNKAEGKGEYELSSIGRYLVEHELPRKSD